MTVQIICHPKETATNGWYYYGVDERTLAWVKADLADVPKDKVIITCSHHNPFKTPNTSPHESHNAYSLNYKGKKTSYGRLTSSVSVWLAGRTILFRA